MPPLRSWLRNDYRTKESKAAELSVLDIPPGALGISIGGGPNRPHPRFVNINISRFENVDVVGDAHKLPLNDETVDAIFSEAVFEHLHSPAIAASEMHRVMKRGAKAFVATPFLQAYHGHPSHFQNYTLAGHKLLFERAGFTVLSSGVLAGPIVAVTTLIAAFCRNFLPSPIGGLCAGIPVLFRVLVGPLDRLFENNPNSHVVCSATYVVLLKS
jgi:SAM-dependent methyltransferase